MHWLGCVGSPGYRAEPYVDDLCPCPWPRVLHRRETVTWSEIARTGTAAKACFCLSSINESTISKKGRSPWRRGMIVGDVYLGKYEAQPQRSECKEHRFLLLVNFMVDLTVLK